MRVFQSMEVDIEELIARVEHAAPAALKKETNLNIGDIALNKQAEKVLKVTFLEARASQNEEITPEHLLLSILKHKDNLASKVLYDLNVDYETF